MSARTRRQIITEFNQYAPAKAYFEEQGTISPEAESYIKDLLYEYAMISTDPLFRQYNMDRILPVKQESTLREFYDYLVGINLNMSFQIDEVPPIDPEASGPWGWNSISEKPTTFIANYPDIISKPTIFPSQSSLFTVDSSINMGDNSIKVSHAPMQNTGFITKMYVDSKVPTSLTTLATNTISDSTIPGYNYLVGWWDSSSTEYFALSKVDTTYYVNAWYDKMGICGALLPLGESQKPIFPYGLGPNHVNGGVQFDRARITALYNKNIDFTKVESNIGVGVVPAYQSTTIVICRLNAAVGNHVFSTDITKQWYYNQPGIVAGYRDNDSITTGTPLGWELCVGYEKFRLARSPTNNAIISPVANQWYIHSIAVGLKSNAGNIGTPTEMATGGSEITYFIDNAKVLNKVQTQMENPPGFSVGKYYVEPNEAFLSDLNGRVRDILIFNKVLSDAEILSVVTYFRNKGYASFSTV